MKGHCEDCEKTVELTEHGACSTCGSDSIIAGPPTKVMSLKEVMKKSNELVSKLESTGMNGLKPLDEAALLFIVARMSLIRGLDVSQFIENAIWTWRAMESTMTRDRTDLQKKASVN